MKTGFLLFCFAILSQHSLAQSFFSVGANYSVLSYSHGFPFGGQKLENFKLTPFVGYGCRFKTHKWTYEPGISFGDLGWVNGPDRPRTVITIYALSLNQFIDYSAKSWLSFGLSPSVNYNIYAGITGKSYRVVDSNVPIYREEKLINWKNASQSTKLNRFVFSITPRVSFHFKKRWSIDLFYRCDLNSVGYPFRILNYDLRGFGLGADLKYFMGK